MLGLAAIALGCQSARPAPEALPIAPEPNPDLVQRGAFLFMDPALSGDGSRSCGSCHPGGGSDGKYYRDGIEAEAGSIGALRTPRLRGLRRSAPYLWSGSQVDLQAVIERMLRVEMREGRLGAPDRAALGAYLLSMPPFDRGRIQPDGAPREPSTLTSRRGFAVFQRSGCAECHPPPSFTTRGRFDVGTEGEWGVPSLRGVSLWSRYGHDGRWQTLEQALSAALEAQQIELSSEDFHRLLAYLRLL